MVREWKKSEKKCDIAACDTNILYISVRVFLIWFRATFSIIVDRKKRELERTQARVELCVHSRLTRIRIGVYAYDLRACAREHARNYVHRIASMVLIYALRYITYKKVIGGVIVDFRWNGSIYRINSLYAIFLPNSNPINDRTICNSLSPSFV